MATTFTTTDLIVEQLRRNVRIVIDTAEPSESNAIDISFSGINAQRVRVEGDISLNLGRFYSIPLALTSQNTIKTLEKLATDLSCYSVWLVVHSGTTSDQIPASVQEWKSNADALMERIVPKGKSTALAGRDIILEGESLLAAAGTPGVSAITLTQFLPFGGSAS